MSRPGISSPSSFYSGNNRARYSSPGTEANVGARDLSTPESAEEREAALCFRDTPSTKEQPESRRRVLCPRINCEREEAAIGRERVEIRRVLSGTMESQKDTYLRSSLLGKDRDKWLKQKISLTSAVE